MSPILAHSEMSASGLRAARKALDLTQAGLGDLLGITNVEVYRKERGDRPITRVQALAVECLLRRAGHNDRAIAELLT
jgi:transcriptional regulator with XRE-family HTH domain